VVAIDKEHAESARRPPGASPASARRSSRPTRPDASQRIARFSTTGRPWLVSVLMVSEGVDIPRLRVGVYATTARTELFFRR
jgi:superfamily II DNA or RNA helicase